LHEEWDHVNSIKQDKTLEIGFSISKKSVNNLLKNNMQLNFIAKLVIDAGHQATELIEIIVFPNFNLQTSLELNHLGVKLLRREINDKVLSLLLLLVYLTMIELWII
jgi:hypothetical protein